LRSSRTTVKTAGSLFFSGGLCLVRRRTASTRRHTSSCKIQTNNL